METDRPIIITLIFLAICIHQSTHPILKHHHHHHPTTTNNIHDISELWCKEMTAIIGHCYWSEQERLIINYPSDIIWADHCASAVMDWSARLQLIYYTWIMLCLMRGSCTDWDMKAACLGDFFSYNLVYSLFLFYI